MVWRRTWPRFVIPSTVLVICLTLCVRWDWDVSVTFYLAFAAFSAVLSITVSLIAVVYRRRLAIAVHGTPAPSSDEISPGILARPTITA
jgi:hypothetical protein